MEMRTAALLLLGVSAVCASPHGYGVKGGAAAKAEARAVAGAYGGEIPVPIQPGSGYSGSFSKSSASSFASSSASSSASSYSFSGSVPPGFDHKGLGSGGCATGSCHNNADKSNPHYGSAPSSLSGARAGAVAGAAAGSITFPGSKGDCGDKGCSNDNASPCNGGECGNSIKKCKSGQCNTPLDDGSNDINSNSAKSSESKDSSSQDCLNGNCGSTISHHAGSEPIVSYPSSAGTTALPLYSNPSSTYLTTPKEPCDSGNCDTSKVTPPSSYNVPLGTINSESLKPCAYGNCDTQASSPTSVPISNQYLSPGCSTPGCSVKPPPNYLQAPNYSDESNDCSRSGTCGTSTSNGNDIGPIPKTPKAPIPSYASPNPAYSSRVEHPSSYSPTRPYTPFSTKNPQTTLDPKPAFVALNGPKVPAYINQPLPGPQFTSPSYFLGRPSYAPVGSKPHSAGGYSTGTFASLPVAVPTGPSFEHQTFGSGCGPSGCGGSYPGSIQTAPSYGHIQPPCKTPGCSTQTVPGAQVPPKPYYDSEKSPPYSGGFGGPTGLLKPNEFTVPSLNQKPPPEISPVAPSFGHGSTPSVGCAYGNCNNSPSYSGSGNYNHGQDTSGTHADNHTPDSGLSGCASGNCNQQPNYIGVAAGSHTPGHGAIGAGPTPCASGNCDQAPNYNGFSSGSTSTGYAGIVSGPAQCKSGNCNQAHYNNEPTTATGVAGSYTPGNVATGTGPSPCASGNCNQAPNYNGFSSSSTSPGYGGIVGGSSWCKSGNCNQGPYKNEPTTGSTNPGYAGVAGNPAACSSGNCNQLPNQNVAATESHTPGHIGNPATCSSGKCNQGSSSNGGASGAAAISSASASAGVYTGGFGGPPGLLKPHDNGKLEGKDTSGKLLASLGSGDQYGASLPNSAGSDAHGSHTFIGDDHGINAHEGSKHTGCNSGCGGDGNAAGSAGASAGASSVAGAKGYGGAFAGSSASAHASSGAHTKGGYAGR